MTKPSRLLGEQMCRGAVAVCGVASAPVQGIAPVGTAKTEGALFTSVLKTLCTGLFQVCKEVFL